MKSYQHGWHRRNNVTLIHCSPRSDQLCSQQVLYELDTLVQYIAKVGFPTRGLPKFHTYILDEEARPSSVRSSAASVESAAPSECPVTRIGSPGLAEMTA